MIKSLLYFIFFLFTLSAGNAQVCVDHYNDEDCPYRFVSEFAVSTQLKKLKQRSNHVDFALNLGMQKWIKNDFSVGVHWFSNLMLDGDKSIFQMGVRPRIAHKLDEDYEVSISPGIILTNSLDDLDSFKGISLEMNLSWKNKVGIVMRIDKHNFISTENETVVNLGLQSHGTTSFYSFGGVLLGGGALVLLSGLLGIF